MAEPITVDNGANTDYDVLVDDVTHATLGTGAAQIVKLADGTVGGTALIGGDATNGLDVDVTRVQGTVTVDGSGVTQPVSHAALTELAAAIDTEVQVDVVGALPAGNNNIGDVDIASLPNEGQQTMANSISVAIASNQSAVPVDGSGVTQPISHAALTELAAAIDTEVQVDVVAALPAGDNNIGNVDLASAIPAGTNNIGDVDVLSVVPGTGATNLGKAEDAQHADGHTGVYVLGVRDTAPAAHSGSDGDYESIHVSDEGGVWSAEVASSQGGCDAFFTYDCDVTEEDVKTSAGSVYGWYIYNDGAAEVYVRLYNATAANTTVGSTAAKIVLPVPAGSAANMAFTPGIRFDTAICIAATTATGASDTTDTAANQVVATIFYK